MSNSLTRQIHDGNTKETWKLALSETSLSHARHGWAFWVHCAVKQGSGEWEEGFHHYNIYWDIWRYMCKSENRTQKGFSEKKRKNNLSNVNPIDKKIVMYSPRVNLTIIMSRCVEKIVNWYINRGSKCLENTDVHLCKYICWSDRHPESPKS